MKKSDLPSFFEHLERKYGFSSYLPLFKASLQNSFDEIPIDKRDYVLGVCETSYESCVMIEKIRVSSIRVEGCFKTTSMALGEALEKFLGESSLLPKSLCDLFEKVERDKIIVKDGLEKIVGLYADKSLEAAIPKNKLPA